MLMKLRKFLKSNRFFILISILMVLALSIVIVQIKKAIGESQNKKFITAYNDGNFKIAYQYINKAISNDPENAVYSSNLAILLSQKLEIKLDSTNKLKIKISNTNAAQLLQLKQLYIHILQLNPYDAGIKHNLGWVYYFMGDTALSIEQLNEAVATDPASAIYRISLGLLYETLMRETEANKCYIKAIELSPEILDSEFFQNLKTGNKLLADSIVNMAEQFLISKLNEKDSPIIKSRLAKIYMSKGRFKEAKSIYIEVTKQLPNLNRPWYYLGYLFEVEHNAVQSRICYQRSLLLDPNDILPNLQMANNYYYAKDTFASLAYYKNAVKAWASIYTDHYYQGQRIYNTKGVNNDLFPKCLLTSIKPSFDYVLYCNRIAAIYIMIGKNKMEEYYQKLSKNEMPLTSLLNKNDFNNQ